MKKQIIFSLVFFFSLVFVMGTTPQTISHDYPSKSTVFDNPIYSPPIILKINTENETNCLWNLENKTPFVGNLFETEETNGFKQIFYEKDLNEGKNSIFIKCGNNTNSVEQISFNVLKKISGEIKLSKEDPLKEGVYSLTIITSKPTSETPYLEYSLDNLVYNPLPLEKQGDNWKTQLIIKPNAGKTLCSFKFRAKDSEGIVGTKITGKSTFLIDTLSPEPVENFEAIGKLGEIRLEWHSEENDIREYEIYKSKNPGVDFIDYFTKTSKSSYIDTDVEKGEKYYYKILAVDNSDNHGRYSKEISATALIYNSKNKTGLDQRLIGNVDNLLTTINLFEGDIETIKNDFSSKTEKERKIFKELKLEEEISSITSEINSLKRDVTRYKLQTITEIELDNKLKQAKLKLNILKKKIPETVTIEKEFELKRELSFEKVNQQVLNFGQETMSNKEIKKTISQTKTLISENKVKIESEAYNLKITYLDGTVKEKTLIIDNIKGTLERDSETKMILSIPKKIAEKASEIYFTTGDEEIVKEDPILSFDSDIKKIGYTINKKINLKNIEEIVILPIKIYTENKQTKLVGFTIFGDGKIEDLPYETWLILIFIILGATYYFLTKKNNEKEKITEINALIKKGKIEKKEGKIEKLKKTYVEIKKRYDSLEEKEKEKIFKKIKKLHK